MIGLTECIASFRDRVVVQVSVTDLAEARRVKEKFRTWK